ncbi:hypothetical protein Lser_V15G11667 [Lactuca serriola]
MSLKRRKVKLKKTMSRLVFPIIDLSRGTYVDRYGIGCGFSDS